VAAINRRAASQAVPIEPKLFDLLARAADLYETTGGAFDVTAGPLSKVWGFYRRQGSMPDAAEVAAALALVGSRKLQLDRARRTIRFEQAGMELNLGAIGKGYALDRAGESLLDAGVCSFAIHGGNSSVIAQGNRQSAARGARNAEREDESTASSRALKSDVGWTVALRHPLKPDSRLAQFRLRNQALGTSGSGTQFFHYQGKRYGHILDPRTGWPADRVLSATVIAPTAELADALSTALYVLGLERAGELCATQPEIAALLVTRGGQAGTVELHALNLADDAWQRL
jgi:thiamine biosynthesis lipoprotein